MTLGVAAPRVAVLATAAVLFAAALASIAIWARNIGMAEDWSMVPAMTGHEPDLLAWLWSQNNEHRLPVQRLIYLGLLRTTGDFRSGMVFSTVLLLALSLMLAAAQAGGGRWRWSAVLFPLALLHLGHWENMVWGWQIQFVWSVFLSGTVLALVAASPRPLGRRAAAAAAAALVLLPVSGANGIMVAAAMAPWLAAQGLAHRGGRWFGGGGASPRRGSLLLAATAASIAMIAVYFVGYERPPWSPPHAGPREFLRAAAHYFSFALGPGARRWTVPTAALVLAFCTAGGLLAARAVIMRPAERLRAGGLVLFIGAGIAVGLAIAVARGAAGGPMPHRYALFATLPFLGAIFAWQIYAPRAAHVALAGLTATYLILLPFNVRAGFEWRNWYVDGMRQVENDIAAGLSVPELAERHYPFLMHWSEDRLREAMQMLRDAGIGPFAAAPG